MKKYSVLNWMIIAASITLSGCSSSSNGACTYPDDYDPRTGRVTIDYEECDTSEAPHSHRIGTNYDPITGRYEDYEDYGTEYDDSSYDDDETEYSDEEYSEDNADIDYDQGSTDGYDAGYSDGYDDGTEDCEECSYGSSSYYEYSDAYSNGFEDGYDEGYHDGYEEGIIEYDGSYDEEE